MRILFAGSPAIAVPSLRAVAARHTVVGALTNPEAPRGRGLGSAPTQVAEAATELGVPVFAFRSLGSEARAAIEALAPEAMAVFAYGRVFGPKFLSLFPRGSVNVHPSLLPKYRGCAPIPAAILNRDNVTGVVVQRVALELDSGDIIARRILPLNGRETTESLSELASSIGAELLVDALDELESGRAIFQPQEHTEATWCPTLSKEDGLVNWAADVGLIDAMARAYYPWPLAHTTWAGARLNLLECVPYPAESTGAAPGTVIGLDKSRGIMVQTGSGLLALVRLQLQAKKALSYRDFANGTRGLIGAVLGAT